MVHSKRFQCAREVFRLRIEGRDIRIDEGIDGEWAVFIEGKIRDGRICDLKVVDLGEMSADRGIPAGMADAANGALRLLASAYGKAGADCIDRMTRARKRVVGAYYAAAAERLGMTLEDYTEKRRAGLRWCGKGRHWTPLALQSGICSTCRVHHYVRVAA